VRLIVAIASNYRLRLSLRTIVRGAASKLIELCVLGLGLLQDGNVEVSVFPEREEILIGLKSLHLVTLQRISPCQT
jgi:hypothetical protein